MYTRSYRLSAVVCVGMRDRITRVQASNVDTALVLSTRSATYQMQSADVHTVTIARKH